jgi:hypothetical protein
MELMITVGVRMDEMVSMNIQGAGDVHMSPSLARWLAGELLGAAMRVEKPWSGTRPDEEAVPAPEDQSQ